MNTLQKQAISITEREIAYLRGRVEWAKAQKFGHFALQAELENTEARLRAIKRAKP